MLPRQSFIELHQPLHPLQVQALAPSLNADMRPERQIRLDAFHLRPSVDKKETEQALRSGLVALFFLQLILLPFARAAT